ncbi:MAG: hypothetical protein CHACPFDD_01223 [Phycisphaerae bacterium]|nr:hypothetical protein [Phycisphaerae bacterium]
MSAADASGLTKAFAEAAAWVDRVAATGLIDPALRASLHGVETGSADDLFAQPAVRPLVVGLFGGTGVGKSSLLNRIVGRGVARVGVRRPTSETLTLYVHRDVELSAVPAPPLAQTDFRVERHADDALAGLALIDAPDFDSTRASNRACALAWLPFIDLVVYVVSPERYRDDVGWRLLLERRGWHGWMFLLNRADEGDARQLDDFERLLRGAGFEAPLLLPTCGDDSFAARPGVDDGFDAFRAQLERLVGEHAVAELRRVGLAARGQAVCDVLRQARSALGDDAAWPQLEGMLRGEWKRVEERVLAGLDWQLCDMARRIAARHAAPPAHALVARWLSGGRLAAELPTPAAPAPHAGPPSGAPPCGPPADELDYLTQSLGDAATAQRLGDFVDRAELAARAVGVSAAAVRARLLAVSDGAIEQLRRTTRATLGSALAAPQRDWRSRLARFLDVAALALPLAALVYAGWQLVWAYAPAVAGAGRFLSGDFLIHSGLLVALAWAVPFAASRALRPAPAQRALGGLRRATRAALQQLGDAYLRALLALRRSAAEESQRCAAMIDRMGSVLRWGEAPGREAVRRLLSSAPAGGAVRSAPTC